MLTAEQLKLGLKVLRSHDPINHFFGLEEYTRLCTDTQYAACSSDAMYKLLTTANQGGKTTAAIVDCAALARGKHPTKKQPKEPISILVIVPSRAQAAGIWGKRLLQASDLRQTITDPIGNKINLSTKALIPSGEIDRIDYSPSPMGRYPGLIKLKNGNEIRMTVSGDVKSWERVQGFPLDAIYRDEAVGNKNLGAELVPRLTAAQEAHRLGTRNWAGFIFWVATATLPNTEFEDYKMRCMAPEPGHAIFWMDPNENPAVSSETRDAQRSAMSVEEASVRLDGVGSAAGNLRILPYFSVDKHVSPITQGIRQNDNIWLGYDPGWDHPFGLVALTCTPEHPTGLRLVWALAERNKTLDYVADRISEFLDGRTAEALVFDPAAKRTEHGRGESMAYQLEQLLAKRNVKSERGILYGRNRYEDTIPLLQRYLQPQSGESPYLIFDQPTPENGVARAVEQFLKYRRKSTNTEGNHPPMGATVFKQDDDLVDPIRYIVSRQPQYVQRASHPVNAWNYERNVYCPPKPQETGPIDEGLRVHLLRIKATDSYPDSARSPFPTMPTGRLLW